MRSVPSTCRRRWSILSRHGYTGPLTIEYEGTGGDPWANTGRVIDATSAALAAR